MRVRVIQKIINPYGYNIIMQLIYLPENGNNYKKFDIFVFKAGGIEQCVFPVFYIRI